MDKDLQELTKELRRISILLALNLTKGESQQSTIEVLRKAGFQPIEIADILKTSPNTVNVAINRTKKRRRVPASAPLDISEN